MLTRICVGIKGVYEIPSENRLYCVSQKVFSWLKQVVVEEGVNKAFVGHMLSQSFPSPHSPPLFFPFFSFFLGPYVLVVCVSGNPGFVLLKDDSPVCCQSETFSSPFNFCEGPNCKLF